MQTRPAESTTDLLLRWSEGDVSARDELMRLVYDELRRLAGSYLRRERPDHTLQPTALVNEAYIRLVDWKNVRWQNRAHFIAMAAQVMRNILVDHARARQAAKRGGSQFNVSLSQAGRLPEGETEVDLLALHEALERLSALDGQKALVVELRFFGGLTIEEAAEALGISQPTVEREWAKAKAWLYRELSQTRAGENSSPGG